MRFDAPIVLLVAPLVGGAAWLAAAWARRARLRRAAQWSEDAVRAARGAGRWGPTGLALSALLGMVALAGPRWGEDRIVAESRGLNLVLAIDISRSMLAEDAGGSRLARALREARRLVQDLEGDRLGLVAFAGATYILAPLSLDGSALTLHLDALDPDVASEGGTALAPALRQGAELLGATADLADRVLVVFTDGEAHDSLGGVFAEAERLGARGIRLILVAEGGITPARIPVRDERGALRGYQNDEEGHEIATRRRDDVLGAVADAAQGTIVAADLPDQAGAVRDIVASYKRSRASEARTELGRPRAWLAVLGAAAVLLAQALVRRTPSLIALALLWAGVAGPVAAQGSRPASPASPARPRSAAERAWDRGDSRAAADAYAAEVARRRTDTAAYNAGTAALAAEDFERARAHLARAAASVEPEVRFRALYNLGLAALLRAAADSANRDLHLADAERAYREALLLKPRSLAAKWNLELAVRHRRRGGGGGGNPPPSGGGDPGRPPPASGEPSIPARAGELSPSQAEQILRSIGQEELRTRRDRLGRTRRAVPGGIKDW